MRCDALRRVVERCDAPRRAALPTVTSISPTHPIDQPQLAGREASSRQRSCRSRLLFCVSCPEKMRLLDHRAAVGGIAFLREGVAREGSDLIHKAARLKTTVIEVSDLAQCPVTGAKPEEHDLSKRSPGYPANAHS